MINTSAQEPVSIPVPAKDKNSEQDVARHIGELQDTIMQCNAKLRAVVEPAK